MHISFFVPVPASKPIIYDTKERDMSKHAEAYPEGSDLELICEVRGGKPIPKVSWFLESQLINSTSEIRQVQSQNSVPYHSSMSTSSLSSSSSSSSSSLSSSSSSSSSSASLQPSTLSSSTRDSTKFKLSTTLIISRVTIKNLKRSHHHAKVSCRASNTPLAAPQTTTITISLYMKPLEVKIINKTQFVSSSRRYQTECKSSGSRPEATLTWYKGSKTLKNLSKDFHKDGMSVSILEWQPDAEDEGKYLTCRAENRHLPDAVIEDKWKLKVHFAPIVQLRVGSSLDLKGIKEGDDVTFECNVRSVPRNFKLSWFHGNKELRHNASTGVVLSDQSLVLQGISREAAGNYSCVATNSEGRNRSNLVPLRVMYAPTCKQLRPLEPHEIDEDDEEEERDEEEEAEENMNALMDFENEDEQEEERSRRRSRRKRLLKLLCAIEANPRSVQFYWTFNNTILEPAQNLPDKRFRSEGLVSRLSHALETEQDYGTFSCWASNEIGQSKQPCVYHVPEPMKPEALQNCTARNQSGAWIRISCYEGADGGLPHFVASVDELSWESDTPEWRLELRKPSSRVVLFAVNARGTSEPVVLEGIVYRDVAKFTGETGLPLDISPILIGLGGTATGLGLIVTGVLMALWRKHAAMGGSGTGGSGSSPSKPKALQQQHQQHQQHLHQPPSIATFAVKGVEEEDGNPDLIPTTALTNNYAVSPCKLSSSSVVALHGTALHTQRRRASVKFKLRVETRLDMCVCVCVCSYGHETLILFARRPSAAARLSHTHTRTHGEAETGNFALTFI
ncbi:unnamed protein product [Trichogramma brassicae]|uniref:Ig-like domain-containing protein n=1 Tax=Trichogramma brassicae TaxID=86971 RepID=A0A6H5HZW6_9HYME|nr:unnamed protein product [Trichogramma brassicae]